jgi:hypothetical protein
VSVEVAAWKSLYRIELLYLCKNEMFRERRGQAWEHNAVPRRQRVDKTKIRGYKTPIMK